MSRGAQNNVAQERSGRVWGDRMVPEGGFPRDHSEAP